MREVRHGDDYYRQMLDGLEPGELERFDREESGKQLSDTEEHEQAGGKYTFAALCRSDQVAILRALDVNLPTRTTRPNRNAGTSYAIKHAVERYTGFYVSNLQAKTAMRLLGYKRSNEQLNPYYNVTVREWRAFSDLSRELEDRRQAARERMARQDEQRACARYFARLTA